MATTERYKDIAVTQLNTEGFDKLTLKQRQLAYHLAQAGLWGRYISVDQGCKYNIELFRALISLKNACSASASLHHVHDVLRNSLFILFAHNGVYHSTSGEKVEIPLTEAHLDTLCQALGAEYQALVQLVKSIWFSDAIKPMRTVQKDGVDVVAVSGGNFYDGLTSSEVADFRAAVYPKHEAADSQVPPYGFNERLSKGPNGSIVREVISVNGLYGPYVKKIIEELTLALDFAENEEQAKSIATLIRVYETGDAKDFDNHCVAWVKDTKSGVYFINGMIESYEDPMGIGCTFESVVAFKNPLQTAKVDKIIQNIQWFEQHMPFEDRFKKKKAQGLSASSITVVSMAGETAPTLPLGINLPNSDWIRKEHGSKSVNLENSASSRAAFEVELRKLMYLPSDLPAISSYLTMTGGLHTDLHEIAGHGSGQMARGATAEDLGVFYSVIEECRADLVALYFLADKKLKKFGVYDKTVNVKKAARAQYVGYLTNGIIGQLRRVTPGQDLSQPHFRNRQLISSWVLKHAGPRSASLVVENGQTFVKVKDLTKLRHCFGKLLRKIQRIKSTGDFEGARHLVMTYGTVVNQAHLQEIKARIQSLNLPTTTCFTTPELVQEGGEVVLKQPNNFFDQQVKLFQAYCSE